MRPRVRHVSDVSSGHTIQLLRPVLASSTLIPLPYVIDVPAVGLTCNITDNTLIYRTVKLETSFTEDESVAEATKASPTTGKPWCSQSDL